MDFETQAHLVELVQIHRRRLKELEKQAAVHGFQSPPAITIEIDEIKLHIDRINTQLYGLPASRTLPEPIPDFVGREHEIQQILNAVMQRITTNKTPVVVCIRGLGGVGKTELALAVAQSLVSHFRDGPIYIELHGTLPNALSTEVALQRIVRAFDKHSSLSPNLDELREFYRSTLQEKSLLIVADNAKDVNQIRSIVPSKSCVLIITTRQRFSLPGMLAIDLGVLYKDQAERFILDICPRIGEKSSRLAKMCGMLPLALRVSASLLANNDTINIEKYLINLSNERNRLSYFRDPDDPMLDVEASLNLSYTNLDEVEQVVLSQLGIFDGSFNIESAQEVLALSEGSDVAGAIGSLRRRSLIEWDNTNEVGGLHDIVKVFAISKLKDRHLIEERYSVWKNRIIKEMAQGFEETNQLAKKWKLMEENSSFFIDAIKIKNDLTEEETESLKLMFSLPGKAAYILDNLFKKLEDTEFGREILSQMPSRQDDEPDDRLQLAVALNELGDAYYEGGDFGLAVEQYEQAAKLLPDAAIIQVNLASAWVNRKTSGQCAYENEQAIAAMRRACELDRTNAAYSAILTRLEQQRQALQEFGELALQVPLVTPIVFEVSDALIPYIDPQQDGGKFISEFIPAMKERIKAEIGIRIPSMRVRGNLTLPPSAYEIQIDEVPTSRGQAALGYRYFDGSLAIIKARVDEVHGFDAMHPVTGAPGCWLAESLAESLGDRLEAAGFTTWSTPEYLIAHIEAVLRRNLARFLGVQEMEGLLEEWEQQESGKKQVEVALPGTRERHRFTWLLQALLTERVPIFDWQALLTTAGELDMATVSLSAMVRAARLRLRAHLPGNLHGATHIDVSPEHERKLLDYENGRPFFAASPAEKFEFLSWLRERMRSEELNTVLVTGNPDLRPLLRRLIEPEFPELPVMATEELLDPADLADPSPTAVDVSSHTAASKITLFSELDGHTPPNEGQ